MEGVHLRVFEVAAGAVRPPILHDDDPGNRRVGGAQRVAETADGLDGTKVGNGQATIESKDPQGGHKEEQEREESRLASAGVLLLRKVLWVGHKAVFAANVLAHEGQAGGHTAEEVPLF